MTFTAALSFYLCIALQNRIATEKRLRSGANRTTLYGKNIAKQQREVSILKQKKNSQKQEVAAVRDGNERTGLLRLLLQPAPFTLSNSCRGSLKEERERIEEGERKREREREE